MINLVSVDVAEDMVEYKYHHLDFMSFHHLMVVEKLNMAISGLII